MILGVMVGVAIGLTGAGGSIFALPLLILLLLILLLNVTPHNAVSIALCAVAASSIFGTLTRLKSREIEWLPAIMFALIGSLFTPIGAWLNQIIPENIILFGFGLALSGMTDPKKVTGFLDILVNGTCRSCS